MSVYENINIIRKCFLDPRSDTHRQTDICDWRPTCLIGDRYACSESMQEKTTLSEPQIAFHPNYLCLIQLLYGLRWGMLVPNSLRWSILVSNKMCRSKKGLRSTILDFNWLVSDQLIGLGFRYMLVFNRFLGRSPMIIIFSSTRLLMIWKIVS